MNETEYVLWMLEMSLLVTHNSLRWIQLAMIGNAEKRTCWNYTLRMKCQALLVYSHVSFGRAECGNNEDSKTATQVIAYIGPHFIPESHNFEGNSLWFGYSRFSWCPKLWDYSLQKVSLFWWFRVGFKHLDSSWLLDPSVTGPLSKPWPGLRTIFLSKWIFFPHNRGKASEKKKTKHTSPNTSMTFQF